MPSPLASCKRVASVTATEQNARMQYGYSGSREPGHWMNHWLEGGRLASRAVLLRG